jgi:Nucleotidyl transferase AbiEii toxin, Type IV TA system
MPDSFEPRTEILPKAQQEIWPLLAPAPRLSLVLYGGTAIALHLGHRISVDFDFFRTEPLNKKDIETSFTFVRNAQTIQEDESTLVVIAPMQSGSVKVSFFGGLDMGTINEPQRTKDTTLLVASLEDLLATKLKAIMDRAEAKDYRDISAMLSAGVSLETALGGFAKMYGKDPGLPLRAMGFFKDGDLPSLPKSDQDFLRSARDRVSEIPEVAITHGSLATTARQQRPLSSRS